MTKIVGKDEYLQYLLNARRPGLQDILAFYEHRVGVISKDPDLMLIPLDDHLVHRGDGVFETLKFLKSKIYLLQEHLQRMKNSCAEIYLSPPCSWENIHELVLEVARAAGTDAGIISIYLGRGPGGFTVDPDECERSSLYIVARRFLPKAPQKWEQGVSAFKTSIPAKQSYLAKVKCVDYLPNVLMKMQSRQYGYDYPLCFDDQGNLAEGTTENVCLVDQKGTLIVPQSRQALAGTTLMRALKLIDQEIEVLVRPVSEEEIYGARELILLGTTIDALSVVRFNDQPINDEQPGPVSRRLRQLLIQDQSSRGTLI